MTHSGLVRWEPFLRDFDTLAGRLNQMFDTSWPLTSAMTNAHSSVAWQPSVDIYDEGDAIVLEAELPGHKRDEIAIRVENGVLLITGERRRSAAENGRDRHYLRSERSFGSFSRSFALPGVVDSNRIEATFQDGILTLTLPKAEHSRPRQIDVKFN